MGGRYASNPTVRRRLFAREVQNADLDYGTHDVREIEMMVDAGVVNPGVSVQFWRDAEVYGFREAMIYLKGYQDQGWWRGDFERLRAKVNDVLGRFGATKL
jgi:hypothetical protein